jgi:sigma-B regulation protein RsbU (phosphoserine phosphatase)
MFGKERVYEVIRGNSHKPAEAIQKAVLRSLDEFSGNVAQEDDVTIVVIKVI